MRKLTLSDRVIGPVEAKLILDRHTNYRKQSISRIEAYAKVMKEGMFRLSVITFDETGDLCDGAHRLCAVVKSGVPVEFAVIYGWPKECVKTMDNGMSRTRSQVVQAERPNVKNANKVMSTCVGIQTYSGARAQVILNEQALDLYDKYGDLAQSVRSKLPTTMDSAPYAVSFCRAIIAFPDREADVMEALSRLHDLDFSDPKMSGLKIMFNQSLTKKVTDSGGLSRRDVYLRCARAIQAYLDNQSIEKVYVPKDDPFAGPEKDNNKKGE